MKARRAKNHSRKDRPARPKTAGLKIPPLLLEGDEPSLIVPAELPPTPRFVPPPEPGPVSEPKPPPAPPRETFVAPPPPKLEEPPKAVAQRAPAPPLASVEPLSPPKPVELPESFGTKRLVLTARDPRWLYAHWDFTREQLQECNNRSSQGHMVLRVYQDDLRSPSEIHVHPESRNWFVQVPQPGAKYRAELGFYPPDGGWVSVSSSTPTATPPAELSPDTSVQFKTVLPELPLEELVGLAKLAADEHIPLRRLVQQLRANGGKELREGGKLPPPLTPEQAQALSEMIIIDEVRRISVSSFEIEQVLRRQYLNELSAIAEMPAEVPGAWSGALGLPSSPVKLQEQRRGFWFNINAELVIYGATEPHAQVTIGNRPIRLRPDGSFTFRFALPDGEYVLPAEATSADGLEARGAALRFSRQTNYQGEVAPHPQSPELKPPLVENVGS